MRRLSTLGLVGLLLLVGCDISSDQAGRVGFPEPPVIRLEPEQQMPTLNTGPPEEEIKEEHERPRFPNTGQEIIA